MCATLKVYNVCFSHRKARLFESMNWFPPSPFHSVSIPTCTMTSISRVAQTTCAIKRPLSVNTVSIQRAIMAAIGAFINIYITYRIVIDQIMGTRGGYFFTDLVQYLVNSRRFFWRELDLL